MKTTQNQPITGQDLAAAMLDAEAAVVEAQADVALKKGQLTVAANVNRVDLEPLERAVAEALCEQSMNTAVDALNSAMVSNAEQALTAARARVPLAEALRAAEDCLSKQVAKASAARAALRAAMGAGLRTERNRLAGEFKAISEQLMAVAARFQAVEGFFALVESAPDIKRPFGVNVLTPRGACGLQFVRADVSVSHGELTKAIVEQRIDVAATLCFGYAPRLGFDGSIF